MSRTIFKAYRSDGSLAISTWTSSPGAEAVERSAYQARLNRGDLARVDVSHDEPGRPSEVMRPGLRQ
jgi:hypothetical protein